jgi:hypothetical protein
MKWDCGALGNQRIPMFMLNKAECARYYYRQVHVSDNARGFDLKPFSDFFYNQSWGPC